MGHYREKHFHGVPVSHGIAIGTIVFMQAPVDEFDGVQTESILAREVSQHIRRYRRAIHSSRKDLESLQVSLAEEGSGSDAMNIISTHIHMLDDPVITELVESRISKNLLSPETAFRDVMKEYQTQFLAVDDDFFKERLTDVRDLSKRILRNLDGRVMSSQPKQNDNARISSDTHVDEYPAEAIVCATELIPSFAAQAPPHKVKGFVAMSGGETSHAALIAKAKGIPFVANVPASELETHAGDIIILDGSTGDVVINPTTETIRKYQQLKEEYHRQYQKIAKDSHLKASTQDGVEVTILSNIERAEDIELVHKFHSAGIGLLRSEFFCLGKEVENFTEEQQYKAYKTLFEKANGLPVTFRLFDVGGDKNFTQEQHVEFNPALGLRSIRFLLHRPQVLQTQLRAVLRASRTMDGDLKILIPLVTDASEVRETRSMLEEVSEQLRSEGYVLTQNIQLGCMIEVPAAALMMDVILRECDFVSIGTNDLIQYTLAADRSHSEVSYLYRPTHPSVLRLIQTSLEKTAACEKPICLCGEMASNPLFTALLLGLGVRQLSVAPRHIPAIKHTIRQMSLKDAKSLAEKALSLSTTADVHQLLTDNYSIKR